MVLRGILRYAPHTGQAARVSGHHSIGLAPEIRGAGSEEEGFYLGRRTGNRGPEGGTINWANSAFSAIIVGVNLGQCQPAARWLAARALVADSMEWGLTTSRGAHSMTVAGLSYTTQSFPHNCLPKWRKWFFMLYLLFRLFSTIFLPVALSISGNSYLINYYQIS